MSHKIKIWALGFAMILLSSVVLFNGCKKENGDDNDIENPSFDRKEMLSNYADHLIIPSISDLHQKLKVLQDAVNDFAANTNINNLNKVQDAWKSALLTWEYANIYNIGPAGEDGLKKGMSEEIATFPINTNALLAKIANNNTSFNDFARDTRGLLAIDYLVFGIEADDISITNYYLSTPSAVNYLKAVTHQIFTYVDGVLNAWNNGYKATFINNNGTSVGSSTALLYNEFLKSYESIKNYKIGLPIGNAPGVIVPKNPMLVEAYYSGISIEAIKIHFDAIEKFWKGISKNGQDGIGFKSYLLSVEGGKALVASTEEQLSIVKNAIDALDSNSKLSDLVAAEDPALQKIYTELSKHTRFFKSDMSSLLGISITYSSGDGD